MLQQALTLTPCTKSWNNNTVIITQGFSSGSVVKNPSACNVQFSPIQSLSHVQLFATPWTAAPKASLSITTSWSLLKLMCIESVMPSNQLILCCPLLLCLQSFPASGSFPMSRIFIPGGESIGASASASVLPKNIQGYFPLGWTDWISLQSKGLSGVFSSTTF